jgi:hypothetical protein
MDRLLAALNPDIPALGSTPPPTERFTTDWRPAQALSKSLAYDSLSVVER